MTVPLYCLLGFVGWTVLLVLGIVSWRGVMVFRGERKVNAFPSGEPHGPEPYRRLNRAHANATENLPLFAAVVLVGHVAGVQTALFAALAQICLGARVFQSLAHVSGNSALNVNLRFTGLLVQLICFMLMSFEVIRRAV